MRLWASISALPLKFEPPALFTGMRRAVSRGPWLGILLDSQTSSNRIQKWAENYFPRSKQTPFLSIFHFTFPFFWLKIKPFRP
jgi:hypothetical protein